MGHSTRRIESTFDVSNKKYENHNDKEQRQPTHSLTMDPVTLSRGNEWLYT